MTVALVLRPEPGNTATARRLAAAGIGVRQLPLFAVAPLTWQAPDPAAFDALLLTSANAVRHAGEKLDQLRALPVVAVGLATAAAATDAGLSVAITGEDDAQRAAALALARGWTRLLHLAGREHVALDGVTTVITYASGPLPIEPGVLVDMAGTTALLHSPRAARRFAELIVRDGLKQGAWPIAALSPAIAAAAGSGWQRVTVAAQPTDAALIDAVLRAAPAAG